VHADGKKIRRSVAKPLPELSKEQQDTLKLRFVYAVGGLLSSYLQNSVFAVCILFCTMFICYW